MTSRPKFSFGWFLSLFAPLRNSSIAGSFVTSSRSVRKEPSPNLRYRSMWAMTRSIWPTSSRRSPNQSWKISAIRSTSC